MTEQIKEKVERILKEKAFEECPKCGHYLMHHFIEDNKVVCKYEDSLDEEPWFICNCRVSLVEFLKMLKEND